MKTNLFDIIKIEVFGTIVIASMNKGQVCPIILSEETKKALHNKPFFDLLKSSRQDYWFIKMKGDYIYLYEDQENMVLTAKLIFSGNGNLTDTNLNLICDFIVNQILTIKMTPEEEKEELEHENKFNFFRF